MKLSLPEAYKSLSPFSEIELPDFTVLTGKNGSGKTQFVELLERNNNSYPKKSLKINIPSNQIQVGTLNTSLPGSIAPSNFTSRLSTFWSDYVSLLDYMKLFELIFTLKPDLDMTKTSEGDLADLLTAHSKHKAVDYHKKAGVKYSDGVDYNAVSDLATMMIQRAESLQAIRYVAQKAGKTMDQLGQNDFYQFPPKEQYLGKQQLMYSGLDVIFYSYAKRRNLNFIHLVANQRLGTHYNCIEDDEFVKMEKSPWDIINSIFEKHGIDYYYEGIAPEQIFADVPLELRLVKRSVNHPVFPSQLSRGEQVMMSLIIALFISVFYEGNVSKPQLYILDEPDAHLHPELSKLLLDILTETFVKELNIKVLITTHSPSTVALAPESALYRIQNGPNTCIDKISKDDSLRDLTYGVPNLSIDYKNHRQIFVEGPSDNRYYRELFNVDDINTPYTFRPYFINAGGRGSNVTHVQSFVFQLRKAGNDKVYGIIDWDLSNDPKANIVVHGHRTFYALENCLFNPIYIIAYHLKQDDPDKYYEQWKIPRSINAFEVGKTLGSPELQLLVDTVIEEINKKYPSISNLGTDLVDFKFLNDKSIRLPKWYLHKQGDALGKIIKETYPLLKGKFANESTMEEAFTRMVIDSYPFVPKASIDLLRQLCN